MKRISLICGLIASSVTAGFAQDMTENPTGEDALSFANRALKMSSSEPVLGTARYSGMAGAMGALGGDGAAVKDNPAALGIYRKWDIGITPNVNIDNDANASFNINNFSCVMNFGKSDNSQGYVTSSFGITYNRIANFNRNTYTTGKSTDGTDYENEFTEDGGSGIWNFAYGMNISNKVYWGIGINAATMSYKQSTESRFGGDWENNTFDVDGSGFNINMGVIVRPADFVRIGAAFTTPTWYHMNEDGLYPYRDSSNSLYYYNDGSIEHDDYSFEYKMQSPLKLEGSVGFILGKRAVIDVDYIYQDYSTIRLKETEGGHQYRMAKAVIDNDYKPTHTLKVGAEIQIAKGFAARLGYAYQSSPTEDNAYDKNYLHQKIAGTNGRYVPYETEDIFYSYAIPKATNYYTIGLGYHGKSFYADLAYVNKQQKEDFYEWQSAKLDDANNITGWEIDPISQTIKTHNIMATIGFKF